MPAPSAAPSPVARQTVGTPKTSAQICRQAGLWLPPPVRRISAGAMPSWRKRRKPVAEAHGHSLRHSAGQGPGHHVLRVQAVEDTAAAGQVRGALPVQVRQEKEALRAGRRYLPWPPRAARGPSRTSCGPARWPRSRSWCRPAAASHPCCRKRRRHPPPHRRPAPSSRSRACRSCPRLAVSTPGAMFPVPIAPIMLSPPPALTTGRPARPHCSRASSRSRPATPRELSGRGRKSWSFGSMKSQSGAHHFRVRTSSRPVPEASPYSIRFSPVSQKLM